MHDLALDLRGAGVFAHLKKPPVEWVTEAKMDRIGQGVARRAKRHGPRLQLWATSSLDVEQ